MQFLPTCTLIIALCLAGCSSAPLPLPPIQPAPEQVANLRIFVLNASNYAAQAAGETSVTGYTMYMRAAVQRSFTRAGYTVVVSPKDPADLIAKIDTESPGLDHPGLASMTVTNSRGIVVEQISVIIELDERINIDERGPVAMVELFSRSPRIATFARGYQRGECEKIDLPGRPVLEVPGYGN